MIRIISKKDGFRRCGVAHPEKPTDYKDGFFSKEDLERLKNEPMLIIQKLPDPELTVADLKEALNRLGVSYDAKANKNELIKLLGKNKKE